MYGISNYLFGAPFSLINAIILSLGIHSFGIFLINNYFSKVFVNNKLEKKKTYFGYLFGYNILLSVFYFFSVFTNQLKIIFIITSITCYIFFFVFIYKILINNKKFKNNYQFFNSKNFFFLLLLFGYFLFSSGPITNADSLDYHAGVGLLSLINEKFTTIITWNTSLNSSSGEIFISFSFFNRTEQLASLTNFFALLSIFIILMTYTEKFSKNQIFFIFLLLSSPPILSLVSTIKPQLIFIASNLIAFVLLVENFISNTKK